MGGTSFEAALVAKTPVVIKKARSPAYDRAADARHPHHRRRRRLDRLARRGRPVAHGPAQRRRDAGAGLLRQGRRSCRPRPTPISCSAISTPTISPAAGSSSTRRPRATSSKEHRHADRPDGRGGGGRHVPRRLQQHGARRARGDHQARLRSARISACGRRRRRADPLLPDLQRAGNPAADRAARSSVLCAFGMLLSELQHDFVRTFVARFGSRWDGWARCSPR